MTGCFAQERVDVPIALDFTPLGTQAASPAREAPADVSFGIYPLSVFGIENAIKRADARADDYANGVERFDVGPIAYSVVAIRDWEHRYPSDPWIPKELLGLCRFYVHVGCARGRNASGRLATPRLSVECLHQSRERHARKPVSEPNPAAS